MTLVKAEILKNGAATYVRLTYDIPTDSGPRVVQIKIPRSASVSATLWTKCVRNTEKRFKMEHLPRLNGTDWNIIRNDFLGVV